MSPSPRFVARARAALGLGRGLLLCALLTVTVCGGDDGGPGPVVDAAPSIDADPACQQLDSTGGFPDCSVCDALESGCDTIDVGGNTSHVCDCSGPCPCGLHCGDIEIAPGVVVGNVCIR